MKTTRELIAEELRGIRAKQKYNRDQISIATGISADTISRYENNEVSMNIETLDKLLNFYGIDFDIFFINIYANKQNNNNK